MYETILNELAKAQCDLIHNVITIADEYGLNRDMLLGVAANSLKDVALVGSFRDYTPESRPETDTDKHWSECRQIALYDDQVKKLQDQVDRLKGIIDGLCGYMGGIGNG